MKIIDSNIIIYSIEPQYEYLRSMVKDSTNQVSADLNKIPGLKVFNPIP